MSREQLVVATVDGAPVSVAEVDAREAGLRRSRHASALPAPGTSEGRQLRRWLTQLAVTERVIAAQAAALGVCADDAPAEIDVLPDVSAGLEIGSVAAAVLADPLARAVFARVTAGITVGDDEVTAYHLRNPRRFARRPAGDDGWCGGAVAAPPLESVRTEVAAHLLGAARRRAFRLWLDARCAKMVDLAPGYEHPGDPRQPDNAHRHP